MANSFVATRAQLIFALCLPLAVVLGYVLADPLDPSSMLMVTIVIGVLSIPVLMRWYHPLLIFTWNAAITPFILPGQPFMWAILAFVGLGFAVVNRFTNPDMRLVSVPWVTGALLLMVAVVLLTMWTRGGIGVRAFGSENYGGKRYFYVLAAAAGYFALVSQRIPRERAPLYVALFFLSGITSLIPNLALLGGPRLEFLFYIFPPLYAMEQAIGGYSVTMQFARIVGLTFSSVALACWLLAHFGLRRILDWKKPLPFLLLLVAVTASAFCGFRSIVILFVMTFAMQFFLEGLYRGKGFLIMVLVFILGALVILPNTEKLPLVVQRSISFLPVKTDPMIRLSAQGSSDWRFDMWRELLPEIPRYLLIGKGFGIDPTELNFAQLGTLRGYEPSFRNAIVAGDYHSGPLSLILPLGAGGFIAFCWLVVAGLKYLYWNYRHGDPALLNINRFLFGYFAVRVVFFFLIFGGFYSDFFLFTGIIGLSASLNGEQKVEAPAEEPAEEPEQAPYHEEFASPDLTTARVKE